MRICVLILLSTSLYSSVEFWLNSLPRFSVEPQKEQHLAPSVQMIQALRWDKCLQKHPYLRPELPLLMRSLATEQAYCKDYHVFYHAASSLSFLYDTIDLYIESALGSPLKDFTFMRIPWKKEFQEQGIKARAIEETLNFEKHYSELQKEIDAGFYTLLAHQTVGEWLSRVEPAHYSLLYSTFHMLTHEKTFESSTMRSKIEELKREEILICPEDEEDVKTLFLTLNERIHSDDAPQSIKEFRALRNQHLDSSFALHKRFSDLILSTNLSLFGNIYSGYDCSLEYWKEQKNHIRPNSVAELVGLCREVGLDERYIEEGFAVYKEIEAEDTWMYMILIPKAIYNERGEYIDPIKDIGYMSFGGYTPARVYDDVKERHPYLRDLSSYLKEYGKKAAKTVMAHKMQGRLVLNSTYLLNPFSGCKIMKFSMIDEEKHARYKKKLRTLFQRYLKSKESHFQCLYSQKTHAKLES